MKNREFSVGHFSLSSGEETDVLHMPPRGGVMEITLRFNAFSNQNPTSFHLCKRKWGKTKERLNLAIFLLILTREQSSICNQIRGIISVIKVNWESKWKNLMLFMLIYFRLEKVKPEVNTKRRSMERGAWQRQKVQIWAIIGVGLHLPENILSDINYCCRRECRRLKTNMYHWQRSIMRLTAGRKCVILTEPLINSGPKWPSHPSPHTACPLVDLAVFPGKGILVPGRDGLFFGLQQHPSLS